MRILLSSHLFWPSIGGVEQVAGLLATEWAHMGHEVIVLTTTPDPARASYPFTVLRRPRRWDTLTAMRWCDVFFQNNISLRTLWPIACIARPAVVAHQTWMTRLSGRRGCRDWIKGWTTHAVSRNVAVSRAVAASVPAPCTIVPNPYHDGVFRLRPEVPRTRELIVVGRLVSDKGIDLCLDAMALLTSRGSRPRLTIVGIGPEEARLRDHASRLGLERRVHFAGRKTGNELAGLLNAHRIMVVPSRWHEPFGIVALEGLACGCVVVGSCGGGLPEALGPCGLTFPNGDATALADTVEPFLIESALHHPPGFAALAESTREHLRLHTRRAIAVAYLRIFDQIREHRQG